MSTTTSTPADRAQLMNAIYSDLVTTPSPPTNREATAPVEADTAATSYPPPPPEPETLEQAGLTDPEVEALILKYLLQAGASTGSQTSQSLCLPRSITLSILDRIREELLVSIKSSTGVNDFVYQLTDAGFQRARRYAEQCNYSGPAPVTLEAYDTAIKRQSIQNARLELPRLASALEDMVLEETFVSQIAQAVNDGRGLFLYGPPGNGKTTLAERVCDALGQSIWIPRMIAVGGDLMRLFDARSHQMVNPAGLSESRYDRRWVLIRRPTVVVGGELTLEQLEASYNPASGVSEAPVQLKANGGALVIDDFGRQRVSSTEILNRLIVPLEKHFDYLHLASGRQIQLPFELLFMLSTNLAPRDLVDEAFLRRIPYKIEVSGPEERQFHDLFETTAKKLGFDLIPGVIDELIREEFTARNRPLRFCHPRDLMRQIKNYCEVHDLPKVVDSAAIDVAVRNYFVGL